MKKLIFAVLLSTCLLLTACGTQSTTGPSATVSEIATPTPEPTPTPTPVKLSPTTGKATTKDYAPVGVMIENSKAARPQSGLQAADIVYEAHMEGALTRFFCIFNDNLPTSVGPVRSSRTYWVKIQQEYGCIYVHFGGSKANNSSNVYNLFKQVSMPKRLDGIVMENAKLNGQKIIWRISSRKAPHNAYANAELIQQYYNGNEPAERGFKFSETAQYTGEDATTITLDFTSEKVVYKYDTEDGVYRRYQGTTPFMDALTGKQVEVKNVIVQIVKEKLVDEQHYDITTEGSGKAMFFLGGKVIEGTWQKATMQSRTIFKDADGNEIVLSPGNTWIHLLPSVSKVTSK